MSAPCFSAGFFSIFSIFKGGSLPPATAPTKVGVCLSKRYALATQTPMATAPRLPPPLRGLGGGPDYRVISSYRAKGCAFGTALPPQRPRRIHPCPRTVAVFIVTLGLLINAPVNAVEDWVTRPEYDFVAPSHRGAVTCIAVDETGLILSAGADGFIVIWDGAAMAARERFQLSQHTIEKIALRPGRSEVAVYESDGIGFYRVSVWDYREKDRRFTLPVTNPVLYCGYTAQGTNLVLGFSGGVSLFDGETGERHGEMLGSYPVNLAVSSRTERTLQTYSSSGVLA